MPPGCVMKMPVQLRSLGIAISLRTAPFCGDAQRNQLRSLTNTGKRVRTRIIRRMIEKAEAQSCLLQRVSPRLISASERDTHEALAFAQFVGGVALHRLPARAAEMTLFDLATGQAVAMPSGYDEFSERAFPNYTGGTAEARALRDLLRAAMEAEGFTVYQAEWWHFDYNDWKQYRIMDIPFTAI